ncbi:hypothetical protein [Nostoc sp. ChiQUE01b]|uniref:hypothetical protein n=1 Tax=Nostoc sp. ChiQUE01b TaxID=3075376 RepID=UPI002AD2A643|nr:hypothetical protein [Nostoc sp. ChiQUE01b]MDZ8264454.1 hypothetical protein [Nostoc sp. ChiQUE01b]
MAKKCSARVRKYLTKALIAGLIFGTYKGLVTGLSSGLIVKLWFGRCSVQHLILRIILSCSKLIPWNYARFLDYCTERLFLQRIGGRYRFIHRLLQEHFAAMPLEK